MIDQSWSLVRAAALRSSALSLANGRTAVRSIYWRRVAALHEVLEDEALQEEAFELIRSLIEKVVVTPADGELRIDLQGELAGVLGLCQAGRGGARPDARLVSHIKVVAGAGFEPASFRF